MTPKRTDELIAVYRDGLLEDTIPFWMTYGLDKEYGGLRNFLAADGSVYCDDKAVWQTGRFGWITARLYNDVEPRDEWLQASRSCVTFLDRHGFDADGRMYFEVTRDGKPLRKRRYVDTENFAIMAFSEFGLAVGDQHYMDRAWELFRLAVHYFDNPQLLPPKYEPAARQTKSHGNYMGTLAVAQQMRRIGDDPLIDELIDRIVHAVRNEFMDEKAEALFETVAADGSRLDGPAGRCVNPGHAIETAWFLMAEGQHRNDPSLIDTGCTILDWSLRLGWDETYGGILYFVDIEGKPPLQYEHDMKLAWPHNEAIYACLLAHHLTGRDDYARWHERIHDWSYAHFPDREHGDWHKYLHRDGSLSIPAKGSHWVSVYHLPRMQLLSWKLLSGAASKDRSRT